MCKRNSDLGFSPEGLQLPFDERQLAAAKALAGENRSQLRTVMLSVGLRIDDAELRADLIRIWVEQKGISTAAIADVFHLSGHEVRQIVLAEPISIFECLSCRSALPVRDLRDQRRMKDALDAARKARPGDWHSTDLLCDACTEIGLECLNAQARATRLAEQARHAELARMSYAEYLMQPEWRAIRADALAKARYRCQMCNEHDERLDVHHRAYPRRGRERPEDLIVLCRSCHETFHRLQRDAS